MVIAFENKTKPLFRATLPFSLGRKQNRGVALFVFGKARLFSPSLSEYYKLLLAGPDSLPT